MFYTFLHYPNIHYMYKPYFGKVAKFMSQIKQNTNFVSCNQIKAVHTLILSSKDNPNTKITIECKLKNNAKNLDIPKIFPISISIEIPDIPVINIPVTDMINQLKNKKQKKIKKINKSINQ